MDKDQLLTVDEAAEWLTVSKPTLWRMIRRGEIPVVKIAQRTIRIKLSDIEAYIDKNYTRWKIIL